MTCNLKGHCNRTPAQPQLLNCHTAATCAANSLLTLQHGKIEEVMDLFRQGKMVTLMLQDEVLEILSGTMGLLLEGEESVTTTMVSIPVGKRHTFWSADSSTELHYKVNLFCALKICC